MAAIGGVSPPLGRPGDGPAGGACGGVEVARLCAAALERFEALRLKKPKLGEPLRLSPGGAAVLAAHKGLLVLLHQVVKDDALWFRKRRSLPTGASSCGVRRQTVRSGTRTTRSKYYLHLAFARSFIMFST